MKKFYSKQIGKTLLSRNYIFKQSVSIIHEENSAKLQNSDIENNSKCKVCNSEVDLYIEIMKVQYYQCNNCLHLQMLTPPPDFIKSLYSSGDVNETPQSEIYCNLDLSSERIRRNEIALEKVSFILNQTGIGHSIDKLWVDIGSGTGEILLALRLIDSSFKSIGFENSIEAHQKALARGINSRCEFFDPEARKYPELENASIVTLFNVLEHVSNPIKFIEKISQQMSEKCYLVVEVPKHPSITSIIQKAGLPFSYRHIYPPDHINIFSVESLSYLLSKFNLSITCTWFFGSDAIEIFSYVDLNLNKSSEGNFESSMHIINKLQRAIDEMELSDVMLVIAKKS